MVTNEHADQPKHRDTAEAVLLDAAGMVMRVRRARDLSQRELAAAVGLDQSQIARIESGRRRVDVPLLAGILALAGYRIAILDRHGVEVAAVPGDVLRDNAGRRMPAHLDVRPASDPPTSALLEGHPDRSSALAWYHHRSQRDHGRAARGPAGVPDQPTAGGLARLEHGRRAARRRVAQARAGALLHSDCTCVDECWTRGRCGDACACGCE